MALPALEKLGGGERPESADRSGSLFAAGFLFRFAHQLMRPAVPVYASTLGVDAATIAFLVAFHELLPLLLAIPLSSWVDHAGRRRATIIGGLLLAATGGLYAFAETVLALLLAQIAAGIGTLLVWTSLQAAATEVNDGEARERIITLFTLWVGLGLTLGPVSGGWILEHTNFATVAACFLATNLALVGAAYRLPGAPPVRSRDGINVRTGFRSAGELVRIPGVQLVLAAGFVNQFLMGAFTSFVPLYLTEIGVGAATIGLLLSIRTGASLAVRPLLMLVPPGLSRGRLLLLTCSTAVATLLAVPLLAGRLWALGAVLLVGGGMASLIQPLALIVLAEETSSSQRGVAMGVRMVINRAGTLAPPIVFGATAVALSLAASFYVSTLVLLVPLLAMRKIVGRALAGPAVADVSSKGLR